MPVKTGYYSNYISNTFINGRVVLSTVGLVLYIATVLRAGRDKHIAVYLPVCNQGGWDTRIRGASSQTKSHSSI